MNSARRQVWVAVTLAVVLTGCIPDEPLAGRYDGTLTVRPGSLAELEPIAQGDTVDLGYRTFNDTGDEATLTVIAVHPANQTQTTLVAGRAVAENVGERRVSWDTTEAAAGSYTIVFQLYSEGVLVYEVEANAALQIDGDPVLSFVAPAEDATLVADGRVTITWTGSDPEGQATAQFGLDVDDDRENGNEIYISEPVSLPAVAEEDTIEWQGEDVDGNPVEAGTYALFAVLADTVNGAQVAEASVSITVE